MKFFSIFVSMSLIYLMIGCSESSSIDIVKSDYIDSDKNMTNSQLLDHRKICNKVIWSDFKDKRDRVVVEYRCELNDSQDFFKNKRDEYIKSYINRRNSELNRLKSDYNSLLSAGVDVYPKQLIVVEGQIKSININSSDEKISNEAFIKYPAYTKVVETFQWIVNKEKKTSLEFGGIIAYINNAEPVEINYRNPHLIFQVISRSDPDGFNSYAGYSIVDKLIGK